MDVCNRSLETVRHSRNLGMEVLSAEEDGVRVRLPWREDLVGNPDTGVLHGGAIFAMMARLKPAASNAWFHQRAPSKSAVRTGSGTPRSR